MAKNPLRNLIERCHKRHANPLQQRQTSISPAVYNIGIPYDYTVHFAHQKTVSLYVLSEANISFMPIGLAPANDRDPRDSEAAWSRRFTKQQFIDSWDPRRWKESWGIQIYTGIPSEHFGARWHDIEFHYQTICAAPDAIYTCIETLVGVTVNPLLTVTNSGGLRFSCRIPNYLHYKDEVDPSSNIDPQNQEIIYPKILGDKEFSKWDARYEIVMGDITDPPIISRKLLFAPLEILRDELQDRQTSQEREIVRKKNRVMDESNLKAKLPYSLGSFRLDLAREAFIKRGFSYVKKNNDFHQWTRSHEDPNRHVLLWERNGIVWIRASSPQDGLPIETTPITDVWNDTGILSKSLTNSLTLSEDILVVQQEKVSPLSIKRITPILSEQELQSDRHRRSEESVNQTQAFHEGDIRILALITPDDVLKNNRLEPYVAKGSPSCINVPTQILAEEIDENFINSNAKSVKRWRSRSYNWERVKDIPINELLNNPFQHGNVCIDPERCETLELKGGDPDKSICPECPAYEKCQQNGYLSQYTSFPHLTTQILDNPQLFINPQFEDEAEEILKQVNEKERTCVLHGIKIQDLFVKCELSVDTLRDWTQHWQGEPLGNFANFLLSAIKLKGRFTQDSVKRIRSIVQAFQHQADKIIEQMCEVNVECRIIEKGYVDNDTDEELAHYTMKFENGARVYVPLNDVAAGILEEKNLPHYSPKSFVVNEYQKISMPMEKAIKLGILNADTVKDIKYFPQVCLKPNWTLWHQLTKFFEYYTRDEDARVRWDNKTLEFRIPPILHSSVKQLILTTYTHDEQHLRRIFPNEAIGFSYAEQPVLMKSNKVFQFRTGIYPRETMLNFNETWDVVGMSELGQRFFKPILSEIDKDPSVAHAVVTHAPCVNQLKEMVDRDNVLILKYTEDTDGWENIFDKTQVIWIVGAPEPPQGRIWRQSQLLFGNDKTPLRYGRDRDTGIYLDDRMQHIYELDIAALLNLTLKCIKLDQQSEKIVVILSGSTLHGITDAPNTFLFDWEDFEVAGGLEKLQNVIEKRQRFETDRDNLTAKSSRQEVERILGCSARQANRILQKLRGGAPLRVPFRVQILSLLAEGNKKTAELVNAIEGNPEAIKNELKRLVDKGEILRVQRGIYASP